jgi:hypothetical protein
MASSDEAAALKRNVVHQTRLKLALRQLDKDRSLRIREINKDTQVFLHRLGDSKKKVSLPDLRAASQQRVSSAPVRQKAFAVSKEPQRGTTSSTRQDSNHSFVTKQSYPLTNNDQRFRRWSGSRSTSQSLCPPIRRNETPSRDQETRTPRDITITPRTSKTQKEVRFSLPSQSTEEDQHEAQRTPSPIVTKGIGLMKIQNSAERPFRRYSASHVRSRYL